MGKDNTYENSNIEVTETSRLEAENIMETSAGELVASQKAQNPGVLYIQMLGGFSDLPGPAYLTWKKPQQQDASSVNAPHLQPRGGHPPYPVIRAALRGQ